MMSHRSRAICMMIAVLAIAACGDATAPVAPHRYRAAFAVLIGEPVSAPVASDVVVQLGILDSAHNAVGSQLVNFVVSDGSLYAASAISSGDGRIFARWTLGTKAGPQWIEARAVDQDTGDALLLGRISVTANAGAATTITSASDGVFYLGEHRAAADVFGAVDRYGNAARVDASTLGLADPWTAQGDSIAAPADATAKGKATMTIDGKSTAIRIFSTPDFRKGTFKISGSCVGNVADSVTFDATLASVAYSADRRTLSFVSPYIPTKWTKGVATVGASAFYSASTLLTPDSVQTKTTMGTFTLTTISPVVYSAKSTTTFTADCKVAPSWRLWQK